MAYLMPRFMTPFVAEMAGAGYVGHVFRYAAFLTFICSFMMSDYLFNERRRKCKPA